MKLQLKKITAVNRFMLHYILKNEPLLFWLSFAEMIFTAVRAPAALLLSQRIVSRIENRFSFGEIAVAIAEMFIVCVAINAAAVLLQHLTHWQKISLTESLDLALFEKTCNMDLQILDDPDNQTLYQ